MFPKTIFYRNSVILSIAKKRVRRPKGLKAIPQSALAKSLREILHYVQDDKATILPLKYSLKVFLRQHNYNSRGQ